jgi:hypothetical protein
VIYGEQKPTKGPTETNEKDSALLMPIKTQNVAELLSTSSLTINIQVYISFIDG